MGWPAGSTGFGQVIAPAGLLAILDQSNHWVSGRPVEPIRV
jgi:hypothetical protein